MRDPNAPPPLTAPRLARWLGLALVLTLLAHLLDPIAFHHLRLPRRAVTEKDWVWLFRIAGYAPLWIAVALVMFRDDIQRFRLGARPAHLVDRFSRLLLVAITPALAGLAAETLKLLSRRTRPPAADQPFAYALDWPTDALLNSSGLGLASSHAAVAFGAAFIITTLHPRYAAPILILAIGCGAQRVAAGAHYLSDVVVAAILAAAVTSAVWRVHWRILRQRHGSKPVASN